MTEQDTYVFSDMTQRKSFTSIDVADFAHDDDLGRFDTATVLVKWTNQQYHDENLRAMFSDGWDDVAGIARKNKGRHRNQYYAGKIATISLGADYMDAATAETIIDAVQPTGMSQNKYGTIALACGNVLTLRNELSVAQESQTVISHDNFARLHSVDFNEEGDRLLTASSSLDLVYEVDLQGNPVWIMDMWDTPFNRNALGQEFCRRMGNLATKPICNPAIEDLMNNPEFRDKAFVIDDPSQYGYLGLTTNLTPVFPNGVAYGWGSDILVTTFHEGHGWVVDRDDNSIRIIKYGMRNPHGFQRDELMAGYMITDTGNEAVSFLSSDFKHEQVLDFSKLGSKKPGLEKVKWLQHTSHISDGVYCAVLAPRQTVTLFNPAERTRRDIPFDPDWGIQQVVSSL